MSISKFRARSRRGWMSIVGLPVLLLPVSSAVRSSLVLIVAGMFIVSCWAGNDGDIEGVKYHMYQRPVIMPSWCLVWWSEIPFVFNLGGLPVKSIQIDTNSYNMYKETRNVIIIYQRHVI